MSPANVPANDVPVMSPHLGLMAGSKSLILLFASSRKTTAERLQTWPPPWGRCSHRNGISLPSISLLTGATKLYRRSEESLKCVL